MKTILLFIMALFLSTLALFWYQYFHFYDQKLHVIFCSVGQGDAVLLRTPSGTAIIYDGGPDQQVLTCLRDHLPFWQRRIDIMLLSHPHADHLVGLIAILKRYTINSFDTEELVNETAMYSALLDLLKKQRTPIRYVSSGDSFRTRDGVMLRVLSPSIAYLSETSPNGVIGERKEFASLIIQVQYGEFDVLLTGDSQHEAFSRKDVSISPIEVLQSPHHGSKTGVSREMIGKLQPQLAVISVGKNTYGHPHKETLELYQQEHIRYLRTDQEGDIEIISDGKRWWVR